MTRTAIRISFPIISSLLFGGLGAAPPKEPADFGCDWDFCGTQSPCLLYRETHPAGHKEKRVSDTGISAFFALHDAANRFLASWRIAPKWLRFGCEYCNLSHISAFWLSRTFQGHPAHSFRFRLAGPRSAPVVPAQKQEMSQQTTPPAILLV